MTGELDRVLRWPLWSWRNLTVTAVVLLALLAFVGRATDGRASSLPTTTPPASTSAAPVGPLMPAPEASPTMAATSTAAPPPPPSSSPVARTSATAVATAFARAWATDGASQDAWYAAMAPWASPDLLRALASTDPAQVPADRIIADARLVTSSKTSATVVVPTDGGDVLVTLETSEGGWEATDIAPADPPPGAETPSLTRATPGS